MRRRSRGEISGGTTSRLVVADLPSKTPLAASIKPPVQTDTMGIAAAWRRMNASVSGERV
jgi:hypothetical protein